SIGDGVFGGYSGLTSIRIPESVTSIGAEAFIGCSDLTRINIPESVSSIGDKAFKDCTNLDVTIDNSEGNVKVGEFAFEACKSVTYLKNKDLTVIDTSDTPLKFRITSDSTVEVMEDYSYRDLDSISIPAKVRIDGKIYDVTSIEEYAFVFYSNLTSINVSSNNSNYSSIDGVLFNKNKTEIVYVPRGRKGTFSIPSSVTSINSWAFYGCNGLTSINIPNSIKSIADSTFAHCYSLTSINIPNSVTSIGASAFRGCYGLTSINIPEGVTSIGYYTFYNCHGLTSIKIPNSVTSIGDGAFRYCSGLTSIDIPNSVTSIGYLAFSECTNLDVTIDNSKNNVTVGNNAFYNCKSVTYLK
ncbi:MAG: leucine-rich repeat domain-containing protein, partial [Paludibacteraceae bacterium]|nr:leucine-rich repeat domain-containing protein [Paludibacteraceae bacterium]